MTTHLDKDIDNSIASIENGIDESIEKVVREVQDVFPPKEIPPLLSSKVILELRGIMEELRLKTSWFHCSEYEKSMYDLLAKVRETKENDRYNSTKH